MRRNNVFSHFKTHLCTRPSVRYQLKQATSDQQTVDYCANIVRTFTRKFLRITLVNFLQPTENTLKKLQDHLSYLDRQHDYENFLATLLMKSAIRSPALVVRAFNVEVARIQDQTTDAKTAEFRLQFWHDTINKMYKDDQTLQNMPANPLAQELFKICCCYSLNRKHLERLITSRRNLLKTQHFWSLEDVEKYAEESASSIYYLILKVAGVENVHADHAASHLGKAQGIANTLRSVLVSNHHRMVSLPLDVLVKYKVSQESVLRGEDSENMRNVAFEVASRANSHIEKARSIKVPEVSSQIFLPAVAVNTYLTKLQKCHFNVFDKSLHRANAWLPLNLYYNRFLKKF